VEKRRRPRRRERRQINLTLAQTGGLPPIREPEQRSTRMPAPTPQP